MKQLILILLFPIVSYSQIVYDGGIVYKNGVSHVISSGILEYDSEILSTSDEILLLPKTYLEILNDGNTVKWFDYTENVIYDGSNFVSEWDNKTGINGIISGALLQAVGSSQPTITASGILFDGISSFMKCPNFTFSQPEFIYIVLKQIDWQIGDRLWDGGSINLALCINRTASPQINIYAGAYIPDNNPNLIVGSYSIIRALYNGASSKLQVNETVATYGNVGTFSANGFSLGGAANNSSFTNIEVKEIIIRKIADSPTDEQVIYDYLANKYGL